MNAARHTSRGLWAFSLAEATALPLRGEDHPLRRESARILTGACVLVSVLALGLFAVWYFSRSSEAPSALRDVVIVHYTDLGVPPSIQTPAPPQLNVAEAVIPPEIAIPEPVADEKLTEVRTIATQAEMSEALESVTMEELGVDEGEPFVVESEAESSPTPDEFIAVDEEPVRIRIDSPVYPEMARAANVEGTVLVRVLVAVDGKVKAVRLVQGHEMLTEAALLCAKTAIFRPALIQNRPVEVWVVMPVVFKLK